MLLPVRDDTAEKQDAPKKFQCSLLTLVSEAAF